MNLLMGDELIFLLFLALFVQTVIIKIKKERQPRLVNHLVFKNNRLVYQTGAVISLSLRSIR